MSANHPAEIEALAAVAVAVEKPKRTRRPTVYGEAKLRQLVTEQIASLVVKQFHVALIRAAGGSFAAGLVLPDRQENRELVRVDEDMRHETGLPPEVDLFLRVIVQALHDELCGQESTPESTAALRDEAHRYFWSRSRKCLVRHCLVTGLLPEYVRELAGKAVDYVYEQSERAFAEMQQAGASRPMTRADRLRGLVADAGYA